MTIHVVGDKFDYKSAELLVEEIYISSRKGSPFFWQGKDNFYNEDEKWLVHAVCNL